MTVEHKVVMQVPMENRRGVANKVCEDKQKWAQEECSDYTCTDEVNQVRAVEKPGFAPAPCAPAEAKSRPEVSTPSQNATAPATSGGTAPDASPFEMEETIFIFDWDDTVLPSSWVQQQGLRLDDESKLSDAQRQQLSEVAVLAAETFRIAKQCGTVVLVTNAERGWIELSCQKFLPTLCPALESIKLLSARTTYETPAMSSPLDWKLCAFESEIRRVFGADVVLEPERRKNILSLGDSMNEREALLRACSSLPNCRSKSLKFVERPDISQICKQHTLITGCFDRIVHHDGNLDLCIRCA